MSIEPIEDDDHFRFGQVWTYRTRPGEEASLVVIGPVERLGGDATVVHVQIVGVAIPNPHLTSGEGVQTQVGHAPISKEALASSVVDLVDGGNVEADFDLFMEGYATWRRAFEEEGAGFWTVSLAEIVGFLESALAQSRGPDP